MNHDFLSCDWGTTSFRLRRVRGAARNVIREIREPAGIKSLCAESLSQGAGSETERAEVLARFLHAKLETLLAGEKPPDPPMPLVISGMASSSVGWRELPYAEVPFPLDGRGLRAEEIIWNKPPWLGPTYLLSGVATRHEMMRGEESEILGLMNTPGASNLRERCLLILPGTHSKHVWIEQQHVVDFRTFMTGELFEVLGWHSLLRASVDLQAHAGKYSFTDAERAAFQEGVLWAREHGLAGGLFRVRTRAVLDRRPLPENTWFFSGLLIGAELAGIEQNAESRPVILAAASPLSDLYSLARQSAAPRTDWIQLPAKEVEQSTITAHALFLQNRDPSLNAASTPLT